MGKTYATSRVIEWTQRSINESRHHEALAYFYCIEQDEIRSTAKAIMRSIVRQVATGPTEGVPLHEAVVDMWKKHGQNDQHYDTSSFDEWEDCLSKLISIYHGVTIVLDALDECKSAERADVAKLFTSLTERCSNVKIFVSTRPESDISRWLDGQPSISMHTGRTAGDVAVFVQDKIAQHNEWPHLDDGLKKLILETLVKKSQGLFLCAHLQIDSLQECLYEEDIQDGLRNLPQKLTELYERLYLCASMKPAEKKFRDRALRWVVCSAKPLSSDELLFAISQEPATERLIPTRRDVSERLILKSCHNFLTLDSSNMDNDSPSYSTKGRTAPVWRLAHQAVAEFFETSASCNEERADMQYEAGKVCLMTILNIFGSRRVEHQICNQRPCPCRTGPYSNESARARHVLLREPLVEYAIHAWPTHVRAHEHQEPHNKSRLSQMLLRFFNDPKEGRLIYDRWLEHASGVEENKAWSAVDRRRLYKMPRENKMSYINLACYLGFPKTLAEMLDSAGHETATPYHGKDWSPWKWFPIDDTSRYRICCLRWSGAALACAHDEAKVLQCLLTSEPPARLDTLAADEMPPIVAAVRGDSVEVLRELLRPQHGISMWSSSVSWHGHVLRLAILCRSMRVLPLLLDWLILDTPALQEAMYCVRRHDLESTNTISLLLEKGVDVNTRLRDGTLLAVAAYMGDEGLIQELLNKGADANTQFPCLDTGGRGAGMDRGRWDIENALEACLKNERESHDSVTRLLVKAGSRASARAVAMVADQIINKFSNDADRDELRPEYREEDRGLLRLLITNISEPNEIFENKWGWPTCALHEVLEAGSEADVKLLLERGADRNLSVEATGRNTMSFVPRDTLLCDTLGDDSHPARQMMKLLENAGADFASLDRRGLNTALAGAAWAGMTTLVPDLLNRGADPDGHHEVFFITALGAAAASARPEAPDIIRMLLDKVSVNRLSSPRHGMTSARAKYALDFPLWLMLDTKPDLELDESRHTNRVRTFQIECLHNWARAASMLVSNGAVWDVEFAQWRKCLEKVEPEFASQEAETLDIMQKGLERNLISLRASQRSSDRWDWDVKPNRRHVLVAMKKVMDRSSSADLSDC